MRAIWLSLVLLAACGAGPPLEPPELTIKVRVTGAVERSDSYHHAADAEHGCRPAVEVLPAPGPGGHFDNLPYRVEFAAAAGPPGSGFRLEIPYVDAGPDWQAAISFRVSMMAGGHFWQGESPALKGRAETEAGGIRGRFRIEGLRTTDAEGAINVEGDWTCPTRP